ncbi:MAG: thiol-disulfide isomerase/thioredoxin [Flavobacteriales bacterium]|jgi:thiol-disulfide isomerase/thioredoxin
MKLLKTVFIVLLFCSSNTFAQLSSGSIAPNFTLTDIDGETHELYDYLDDGKAVLLDFFTVWCGPCQSHAPTLDAAYQTYGSNGDNSMVFLALESDNSTTDAQCNNYNGFQWSSELSYPIINTTNNTPAEFNINYYPTVYVVCPNKIITEVGQIGVSSIGSFVAANCEISIPENDLKLSNLNANFNNCTALSEPTVELKNIGSNSFTNPQIDVFLDGVFIETITWQGTISTLQTITVSLTPMAAISVGSHALKATISEDDVVNNNITTIEFSANQFTNATVEFNLVLDNYPSETTWQLLTEDLVEVYSGSGYTLANSSITESFYLELNECYTFAINDSYGDGICCSLGAGSYSLESDGVSFGGGDFGFSESVSFYIGDITSNETVSQLIDLPAGWSIFSTYMEAANPDFENVVSAISEEITIAKNYLGSAYLPEWSFNGIGAIQLGQGYQIKVKNTCSFTVAGTYLYPQLNTLNLFSGWNIISYLRLTGAPANLVFNNLNLEGAIVIVKDANGAAYLPIWDFNGIGDLNPGSGYQVKTNAACQLMYLSNLESYE